MKYLYLISAETLMEQMPETDAEKHYEEYSEFTEAIRKSGHFIEQPVVASLCRDHGPGAEGQGLDHRWAYAETKEQLGGYYIIEPGI